MSEKYKKRIICNLPDYEYGEFISSLKYENIPYPVRLIRFFIESYLAGDKDARAIVENYKQKNKVSGRAKKEQIIKQEDLAKKTETLYSLDSDDIDGIYDLLDETMPDWGSNELWWNMWER